MGLNETFCWSLVLSKWRTEVAGNCAAHSLTLFSRVELLKTCFMAGGGHQGVTKQARCYDGFATMHVQF